MPWASCESHLELSEEEVLGLLQGCRRCFCTDGRMERARARGVWDRESPWAQLGAGTSRPPLQHTQLPVRIRAGAQPAPEPEAVQPQQPSMVPHLIKAVERQG